MPINRVHKVRVNVANTTGPCGASIHYIHSKCFDLPSIVDINEGVFKREGGDVIGVSRTPAYTNKRDFILLTVSGRAGDLSGISAVVDINTPR